MGKLIIFLFLVKALISYPITVFDDEGREIIINSKPKRIISLYAGNTEILYALGLGENIVGVTISDNYPEEVKEKPKIGSHMNPNVEKIISLHPDIVFARSTFGRLRDITEKLSSYNIVTFVVNPKTIEDLFEDILIIGKITGQEKEAAELVSNSILKLRKIKSKLRKIRKRKTVFFEVSYGSALITRGRNSIVNDVIEHAGGINIVSENKDMLSYSLEALISKDPDVYIAQKGPMNHPQNIEKRPGFSSLKAVKTKNVFIVDEYKFSRPGPRIIDAVEELFYILYGKEVR